ncbi:glycosyltransferase family 2 protein [Bacteroidales bacterium OttesenSCG-928-A17]|nr:glycosyltransferase family 2 protein [Bacteroidales bacterium OttesenSCG-928-A17]
MEKRTPELVVVIPCYKEPNIQGTLQSIFDCEDCNFPVEIILLINSYKKNSETTVNLNRISYREALDFAGQNNKENFYLSPYLVEDLPGHQTGAGLPRKLGMDKAISHFSGNKNGIIVSLDADCLVEKNYLSEIYKAFKKYRLLSATIEFHHPVDHLKPSDPLRKAMESYEKYLRYYRASLEFCGYPYAYFTIGSAFAVTADAYLKVGGMGKQQSGEDFYFLQKIFPLGRTRFIDTTCVYPAARTSDRIPFGTGPALAQMLNENQTEKYTYQFRAFEELKLLFDKIDGFFQSSPEEIRKQTENLPIYMLSFLNANNFYEKIEEINRHTANKESFRKRFFAYFTAFRILKYLNSVHPDPFPFTPVE